MIVCIIPEKVGIPGRDPTFLISPDNEKNDVSPDYSGFACQGVVDRRLISAYNPYMSFTVIFCFCRLA